MELSEIIVGTILNEIQKKSDEIKLVFEDTILNRVYVLTFKGLLFETSSPTLNKRVKKVQLTNVLGFRALAQLQHQNLNLNHYRQLFIQMEGSNDNNKLELLGALKDYKVSARRKASVKKPLTSKKKVPKPSVA
jgi:hypothetical protein